MKNNNLCLMTILLHAIQKFLNNEIREFHYAIITSYCFLHMTNQILIANQPLNNTNKEFLFNSETVTIVK